MRTTIRNQAIFSLLVLGLFTWVQQGCGGDNTVSSGEGAAEGEGEGASEGEGEGTAEGEGEGTAEGEGEGKAEGEGEGTAEGEGEGATEGEGEGATEGEGEGATEGEGEGTGACDPVGTWNESWSGTSENDGSILSGNSTQFIAIENGALVGNGMNKFDATESWTGEASYINGVFKYVYTASDNYYHGEYTCEFKPNCDTLDCTFEAFNEDDTLNMTGRATWTRQ